MDAVQDTQALPSLENYHFYHTMDLPGVGIVRGEWHIRDFPQYIGSARLAGKSVLDVGTASGFLSFQAERAGASQVVSFDADRGDRMFRLPYAQNLYWKDWKAWVAESQRWLDSLKAGYRFAHHRFGSAAQPRYGDIFHLRDLFPEGFDISIAGAILEHLNDPVSGLASIASVTRERLIIAFTPIIDSDEILLQAATPMTDPASDFTWWTGSRGMYQRVLKNMGFEIESIKPSTAFFESAGTEVNRSTLIARRRAPFR